MTVGRRGVSKSYVRRSLPRAALSTAAERRFCNSRPQPESGLHQHGHGEELTFRSGFLPSAVLPPCLRRGHRERINSVTG